MRVPAVEAGKPEFGSKGPYKMLGVVTHVLATLVLQEVETRDLWRAASPAPGSVGDPAKRIWWLVIEQDTG